MTDIEQKALALVKAVGAERQRSFYTRTINRRVDTDEALCRAIEQHEAFRQEVSDIVHHYVYACGGPDDWEKLTALIIPAPKPDPLEEVLQEIDHAAMRVDECAKEIRASLDARGFEIKEKSK